MSQPPDYPSPYQGAPYGQPSPGTRPYQPGPYQTSRTNTMAILALVFAFVFWPLGIIFGHVARGQIRRTGEAGGGLALAGLILSYLFLVLLVIFVIVFVVAGSNSGSNALGHLG